MLAKIITQILSYKRKILVLAVTAIAILCSMLEKGNTATSGTFPVWVVPSLQRIGKNESAGSTTDIQLFAARGEYESFQIGIKAPSGGLNNTNLSISDLSGPNNSVISKANITLYRQHYVPVNNSSPTKPGDPIKPLQPGLYPDALIPFTNPLSKAELGGAELDAVPFELGADENQPIWVDVFVPRNASSGDYTGEYTVTSNQGQFTGKISLKVWNFTLPLQPSLKSSFLIWDDANKNKNTYVEVLKHRVMPGTNIEPSLQRELIDNWGLNSLRLPYFSGANVSTCLVNTAPSVEEIKTAATKNVSGIFQYILSVDEIDDCSNVIEPLKQWAKNINEAGVKHLALMTPIPELYKNIPRVDIWTVQPLMYEAAREKVSKAIESGGEVWFYTDLAEDNYSPKWLIDFAPINFRIPHGFINQSLGWSGAFYWRIDYWQGNPWTDEQTIFQNDKYYPGEGMLVYPGEQVGVEGVVPSIRLKWIRDGVEDYEYVQILKKLGRTERALEISRSIASGWKNWTKDPQKLEKARQTLANEIEEIAS